MVRRLCILCFLLALWPGLALAQSASLSEMYADHAGHRGVAAGAAEGWGGGALISEPSQWRQDAVASHWCGLTLSDR